MYLKHAFLLLALTIHLATSDFVCTTTGNFGNILFFSFKCINHRSRPICSNNQFYKKNHEIFGSKVYLVFSYTEEGWVRRGGKGKGVMGTFSFRIVCQNHIPFFLHRSKKQNIRCLKSHFVTFI